MADSTLDSELFSLKDNWPGQARVFTAPAGGFTNSTDHNVATATKQVGTKRQVRNHASVAGRDGWSTLIYLKFLGVSAVSTVAHAAKQFVIPNLATNWWQVSNEPDNALDADGSGMVAVTLSAMSYDASNAFFGWAWCGGVCPEEYVPALSGDYRTENDVVAGPVCINDLSVDLLGLALVGADEDQIIGYALQADAA